jgi:hypothetical protein
MIVSIDPENPGRLLTSTRAYDRPWREWCSGAGGVKPGMMMGQHRHGGGRQASGRADRRVYCWVDAGSRGHSTRRT